MGLDTKRGNLLPITRSHICLSLAAAKLAPPFPPPILPNRAMTAGLDLALSGLLDGGKSARPAPLHKGPTRSSCSGNDLSSMAPTYVPLRATAHQGCCLCASRKHKEFYSNATAVNYHTPSRGPPRIDERFRCDDSQVGSVAAHSGTDDRPEAATHT